MVGGNFLNIWGLWHTPLFLLPGTTQYGLVAQQPLVTAALQFVWFVASTVALSVLLGWLMTETRSVPTTMVLHAASNTGYSLLAVLGVYSAWQVQVLYPGLLVLASVFLMMILGTKLKGSFHRPSSQEL